MTEKSERYVLTTPGGEYVLDGTFRPAQLAPTGRSHNLVRARGYRQVYDLSDGLPDPAPIVLTGQLECETEDALASRLTELQRRLRTATRLGRTSDTAPGARRWDAPVLGGSALALPGETSNVATVTLTIICAQVPDVDGIGPYF